MNKEDAKAAFLILESTEQGRPVEFLAQYIASYIVSGELNGEEVIEFVNKTFGRTLDLISDPAEIWMPLLPGGPGFEEFRFSIVEDVQDHPSYENERATVSKTSEKPKNIVLTFPLAIYQNDNTIWFSDGAEFFTDEMGEPWVKFVSKNGPNAGREHIVHMNNISHFVRRG